jgi:regulator of sigma E protease
MRAWLLTVVGLTALSFLPGLLRLAIARVARMRVDRFTFGFGPSLTLWRGAETTWQLGAVPLGAFVRIAGLVASDRPIDGDDPRAFDRRPLIARVMVLLAGPLACAAFAIVLTTIAYSAWGIPVAGHTPLVGAVTPDKPAALAGLQPGDEVLTVDGRAMRDPSDVAPAVQAAAGAPVTVEVRRAGERRAFVVTPVRDGDAWRIGIQLDVAEEYEPASFARALGEGARFPFLYARFIVNSFARIAAGKQRAEFSGPVGIVRVTQRQVAMSPRAALTMMAIHATYLGLYLLLPLPAFDGGRLLTWLFRRRRRSDVRARDLGEQPRVRARMPASMIAVMVLLAILLAVVVAPLFVGGSSSLDASITWLVITLGVGAGALMRRAGAWLAARNLFAVALVVTALVAPGSPGVHALAYGAVLALLLALVVLLSLSSSRAWFGLRCPACANASGRPVAGARGAFGCLDCGSTWRSA